VLLAQGELDEVVAHLTRSLTAAEGRGWLGVAIELYILRSLALVRQGATQGAEADLERALALAEPEGYVRIFLDEGQPMQMLLAQWLVHADSSPLRDCATYLLSQFDAEPQAIAAIQEKDPSTGGLIEPLSQREMEVLHLIALGRTNKEIARQLIVAPGTVKAHTSSIYRKLDVANRTEAAARARQLGILP
jgi:LuxR family maltose regulon positive regulatory protein